MHSTLRHSLRSLVPALSHFVLLGLVGTALTVSAARAAATATTGDVAAERARFAESIKNVNRWGPEAPIVQNLIEELDKSIAGGSNLVATLGAGLTKAHQACRLSWVNRKFTFAKLTAEEAAAADLKEMTMNVERTVTASASAPTKPPSTPAVTPKATLAPPPAIAADKAAPMLTAVDDASPAAGQLPKTAANKATAAHKESPADAAAPAELAGAIPKLEGTTWGGTDSQGDYYEYSFLPDRQLAFKVTSGGITRSYVDLGDYWAQNGRILIMTMTNYATRVGKITGNTMSGDAWNVAGLRWSWKATLK